MKTQDSIKPADIEGECVNPEESLQAMIEAARALTVELRAAGIFADEDLEIPGTFVGPAVPSSE